jgi:hypothetical protein
MSLCLINQPECVGVSGGIAPHILTSALGGVEWQLHAPAD